MNMFKEDELRAFVELLCDNPYTIPELAQEFSHGERTIKRWIEELRRRGFRVVRDGVSSKAPYYIAEVQS